MNTNLNGGLAMFTLMKRLKQCGTPKRPIRLYWFHWAVIIASLVLTFSAWYLSQKYIDEKKNLIFQREAEQVIAIFKERMEQYEDLLWAGVAVMQLNNGRITNEQWEQYVDNLNVIHRYPGINGVGVIEQVIPGNINNYLENMRVERNTFKVYPSHDKNILLPISYISPFVGNEKAVGLDVAHEENRYQAALRAKKTGLANITKAIVLVQDDKKTPGFLFYAPYYKGNLNQTEMAREKNFQGMVYAPFIINKLVNGILSQENRHVAIKVIESGVTLYNEHISENKHYNVNTQYKVNKVVDIYGQKWTFCILGSNVFDSVISETQPYTILIGGLVIDSLLLFLFITIARSNKYAVHYACELTKKLETEAGELKDSNNSLVKVKNKLEKVAHYDTLTHLPNRYSFLIELRKTLVRSSYTNKKFAVCFIDIDNFKLVNDNLGHDIGDLLLNSVAEEISSVLRDVDYFSRLSGDEFGLIIDNVHSAHEVSEIVSRYHNAFFKTHSIKNHSISVSSSIGVAFYPAGGNSENELIKNADIAMYKAKESGKNKFKFFNEETSKQVKRRHLIETGLQDAIVNDEFFLVYQPQVDGESNAVYGVEVLIRWVHESIGLVSPAEFIPIAEEGVLINDIGMWVFRQVAKDYSKLLKISSALNISVNVSMRQLEDKKFSLELLEILNLNKIKAENITIEVTETAVMNDPEKIIDEMNKISNLGIKFALDDFGTGYSSMSYLKRLPISFIKIDQGFVGDIESDSTDAAIVQTIINLSKTLGARATAEGVETKEQCDFLKINHCDYLQGYYFYKPTRIDELLVMLNINSPLGD